MNERKNIETNLEDTLPVIALPLTLKNLLFAIGQTPFKGPLPQIGTYKGNNEVEVPHLIGNASKESVADPRPLAYGSRVVVFTQGDDRDWNTVYQATRNSQV